MANLSSGIRALRAGGQQAVDVTLRSYACILFSSSRMTGLLLFCATALEPTSLLGGLAGLATAGLAGRLLHLEAGALGAGPYGCNALLVGLGMAHLFGAGPAGLGMVVIASLLSVFVTASLAVFLTRIAALPVLSMPFVAVLWLMGNLGPCLGLASTTAFHLPFLTVERTQLSVMVESLGGIIFAPRFEVGLLVFAALLVHSRISALLAICAGIILLPAIVPLATASGSLLHPVLFNSMLATIAIGAVFFVPSTSSFVLAGVSGLLTAVLAIALAKPLSQLGLPLAILPFNLATLAILTAMRQRTHDEAPQSIDFIPGTPEQNLSYARTRSLRRVGSRGTRFRLPFRGAWTCTQGVDGPLTHQGMWRHGFDFEVKDGDGRLAGGHGTKVEDFHCHGLPILAAADGTVVRVDNDVPDNVIGGIDLERNWGNVVILCHGPGLYSLVAHLAQGSVRVHHGQAVRAGEVLGLCGNSGRSPQPHVHFQLQSSHQLGSATRSCQFEDVVVARRDGEQIERLVTPKMGDLYRNLEPDPQVATYFAFRDGDGAAYSCGNNAERIVAATSGIGQLVLKSLDGGGALYYARSDETFTVLDVIGRRSSVLQLIRAALSRVPFDSKLSPRWRDYLPPGWGRSWGVDLLSDFIAPFSTKCGLEVEYSLHREESRLVVEGVSLRRDRHGTPLLRTRADLLPKALPIAVRVEVRSRGLLWRRAMASGASVMATPRAGVAAFTASSGNFGRRGSIAIGHEGEHATITLASGASGELFTYSGDG